MENTQTTDLKHDELKSVQGGGLGDYLLDLIIDAAIDRIKKLIP